MSIDTAAVGLALQLGRWSPLDGTPLLIFEHRDSRGWAVFSARETVFFRLDNSHEFLNIETAAVGLSFLLGRQSPLDWTPLLIFEHRDSRGWDVFSARERVFFRLDSSLDF